MSPLSSNVIGFLGTVTLLGQILAVLLLALLIMRMLMPKDKKSEKIARFISQNFTSIVLIVSTIATVASLTLSDVLNIVPCKLCWYQRIFMYPVVVISFIALITNETVKKYVLTLSVIGIAISTYHILLQMFPNLLECNDETAKCSAVQFAQYGYITIPVMAFTAFLLIILFSLVNLRPKK